MPSPFSTETHTCKSCGNHFVGDYCNQCGEKVLRAADRSFKTFLSNILIAITFADSKMIKTLWLVIKKPGFVSYEVANGRRVNYLKPISLFFVLNLVYFFFPVIQLFNASLNTQLISPLGKFFQTIVAHKIIDLKMNVASFSLVYNLKTTSLAKLMVMVFVVIASLPLNLLYWKKNRYFTDHVGYTVELACFNLFINAIILSIFAAFLGAGKYLDETVLTVIFISTNLYFVLRSGYQFYGEKGWRLILKSVIMILFLKLSLEIYRTVLFFVTVWSL
jgi:Protein of unknown function (DUF3667)